MTSGGRSMERLPHVALSNGRRSPEEMMGTFAPPNRSALNGMGEFILAQVRRGASDQQWADWLKVPFEHACIAFDMSTVKRLLEAGVNGPYDKPRDPRIRRHTLLHVAAAHGNTEVVSTLLRWGSTGDVAAREPSDKAYTPLHRAVLGGHAEIARILIKAGADKDARTGGSVATPLHLAARKGHEGCVRTLLLTGADRDARRGLDGATPLHQAAFFGQVGAVRALLHGVVNPNSQDAEGCTPIFLAAQEGHHEVVVDLLANGALPDVSREDGWTPLHAAARFGHASTASALVTHGHADIDATTGDHGSTPLHVAAISGFDEVLMVLMDVGSDLEAADSGGWTPLHCACAAARASCVNALIARGADPMALTPDSLRPATLIGTDLAEGEEPNSETNESIWRMLRVPRAEFEARRRRYAAKHAAARRPPPPYNDRGEWYPHPASVPRVLRPRPSVGAWPPPAYTPELMGGMYDSQGSGSGTASVTGSVSGSMKSGSRQHRSPTPQGPRPGAGGGGAVTSDKEAPRAPANGFGPASFGTPSPLPQGPVGNGGGGGGAAKPNSPLDGNQPVASHDETVESTFSEMSPEEARVADIESKAQAAHFGENGKSEAADTKDAPREKNFAGSDDAAEIKDSPKKAAPVGDVGLGIEALDPPAERPSMSDGRISPSDVRISTRGVVNEPIGSLLSARRSPKWGENLRPSPTSAARISVRPSPTQKTAPNRPAWSPKPAVAAQWQAAVAAPISSIPTVACSPKVDELSQDSSNPTPQSSTKGSGKIRILRRRASGGDLSSPAPTSDNASRTNGSPPSGGVSAAGDSSHGRRSPEPIRRPKPMLDRRVTSVGDDGSTPEVYGAPQTGAVVGKAEVMSKDDTVQVPAGSTRPSPVALSSSASSPPDQVLSNEPPEDNTAKETKPHKENVNDGDNDGGGGGSAFLPKDKRQADQGRPQMTMEAKRSSAGRLSGTGGSHENLTGKMRARGNGLVAQRIAAFDPFSYSNQDAARMKTKPGFSNTR